MSPVRRTRSVFLTWCDVAEVISLTGVKAYGYHGVLDSERCEGQDFTVDVEMEVDTAPAAQSDDVGQTVNYAEVAADIVAIIEGEPRHLIETVVAQIADTVLAHYELVQSAVITLHKPHAPVGVAFSDVSIRTQRRRDVPVVVAVGANLDQAKATVAGSIRELSGIPGVWGVRASPSYRTTPVGGPEQDDYVNAVVLARTSLSPHLLLKQLQQVEDRWGRTRTVRWGPRTLDLDLVQYGDPGAGGERLISDGVLDLPHPRAHQRGFVLVPWLAVDDSAALTVEGTIAEVSTLVARLDTTGVTEIDELR